MLIPHSLDIGKKNLKSKKIEIVEKLERIKAQLILIEKEI